MSKRTVEKNKLLPLWEINKPDENKKGKYQRQHWYLFDSIYEGVLKYSLSYKTIANILEVEYKRISNIVRTIKEKLQDSPINFTDYEFYDDFGKKYSYTYLGSRIKYEKYLKNTKSLPVGITFASNGKYFTADVHHPSLKTKSGLKKRVTKSFSVKEYGYDGALEMAIKAREAMLKDFGLI